MEEQGQPMRGPSWSGWAVLTSVGWFTGFFAGFVLASAFEPVVGRGPMQSVAAYGVLGLCLGAGVGLMQWGVLRKHIAGIAAWVLAGAIGMGLAGGVGYGVAVLLFGYSEGLEDLGSASALVGWTLAAACGGIVTGTLQQRVLSQHIGRAGRWVPFSALGWALSITAFGSMGVVGSSLVPEASPVGAGWFFSGLIAGGVSLGVITGWAMTRLFRSQATEAGEAVSSVDGCRQGKA